MEAIEEAIDHRGAAESSFAEAAAATDPDIGAEALLTAAMHLDRIAAFDEIVDRLGSSTIEAHDPAFNVMIHCAVADALIQLNRHDEARTRITSAIAIAETTTEPISWATAYEALARLEEAREDASAAYEALVEACNGFREVMRQEPDAHQFIPRFAQARYDMAYIHTIDDEWCEAAAVVDEALSRIHAHQRSGSFTGLSSPLFTGWLDCARVRAEALFRIGRATEAAIVLDEARRILDAFEPEFTDEETQVRCRIAREHLDYWKAWDERRRKGPEEPA